MLHRNKNHLSLPLELPTMTTLTLFGLIYGVLAIAGVGLIGWFGLPGMARHLAIANATCFTSATASVKPERQPTREPEDATASSWSGFTRGL